MARASGLGIVHAVSRQSCARRRKSSALLRVTGHHLMSPPTVQTQRGEARSKTGILMQNTRAERPALCRGPRDWAGSSKLGRFDGKRWRLMAGTAFVRWMTNDSTKASRRHPLLCQYATRTGNGQIP